MYLHIFPAVKEKGENEILALLNQAQDAKDKGRILNALLRRMLSQEKFDALHQRIVDFIEKHQSQDMYLAEERRALDVAPKLNDNCTDLRNYLNEKGF